MIAIEPGHAVINVEGLQHRMPTLKAAKGPAQLAVRPNAITLSPGASPGSFSGHIIHAAYLGDHVEYEVKTRSSTLFVIDSAVEKPLPSSTEVTIGFRERGIAIIGA